MTVKNILKMRKDTSSLYYDFIEYFVSSVVGKNLYNYCRSFKLLSEFTTVSDEALAILIYENNIDTWNDMASRKITKNSNVSRKYTNGGSLQGQVGSSRKYQDWSSSGMQCFNKLYNLVEKDCGSSHAMAFEESFQDFCVNGGVSGKTKKPPKLLYEAIKIHHSLWIEHDEVDNLSKLQLKNIEGNITIDVDITNELDESDEVEDPYGNNHSSNTKGATKLAQV